MFCCSYSHRSAPVGAATLLSPVVLDSGTMVHNSSSDAQPPAFSDLKLLGLAPTQLLPLPVKVDSYHQLAHLIGPVIFNHLKRQTH